MVESRTEIWDDARERASDRASALPELAEGLAPTPRINVPASEAGEAREPRP